MPADHRPESRRGRPKRRCRPGRKTPPARRIVARWLDAHGQAALHEDACLLVSESAHQQRQARGPARRCVSPGHPRRQRRRALRGRGPLAHGPVGLRAPDPRKRRPRTTSRRQARRPLGRRSRRRDAGLVRAATRRGGSRLPRLRRPGRRARTAALGRGRKSNRSVDRRQGARSGSARSVVPRAPIERAQEMQA